MNEGWEKRQQMRDLYRDTLKQHLHDKEWVAWGGDTFTFLAPRAYMDKFSPLPLKAPIPLAVTSAEIPLIELVEAELNVYKIQTGVKSRGNK